ncbi:MAG TPA: IlvD/Edd family dehydratase [Alphaproteobacteria bacterium]|nr:IlvD/Edd family dehydratase [Alphaproteobacteria bacterium]
MADDGKHGKGKGGLRSQVWFGDKSLMGFGHRSWLKNQGHPQDMFEGRPVIGIANSASDLVPCNAHHHRTAEYVARGVYQAGGWPMIFPTMSLGETLMRPSTMMFRNLMSMDLEETLRANPLDAVVLLTGCDKTTPAYLMGAASVNLPTMVVHGGPMLNGKFRGRDIGSGTDVWRMSEQVRAGELTLADFMDAESCMSRSQGHCMTMGTASTMGNMVEALGLCLPGSAALNAVDARKYTAAQLTGRRIVEMVRENVRMADIVTREAFENAIKVNAAIGGSTNAIVHLIALAGRLGVPLTVEDWDELSKGIPCIVNLQPNGQYLMEDYNYAGGLPVVMKELGERLNTGALTVTGKTVAENVAGAECFNREVIFTVDKPFKSENALAVLKGNLCPQGAVIKPSAATPALMQHRGRAVVFENVAEMHRLLDDDSLEVDPSCILVLKGVGPRGYPGMPEVGNFPLPKKILKQGITDMVRISDGRMSGTAYGTVVLHVAPESAIGGPLGLVETGDMIELDVAGRRLHLDVPEEELERRRAAFKGKPAQFERGYAQLFVSHVLQADQGCDFDFLVGASGDAVARGNH